MKTLKIFSVLFFSGAVLSSYSQITFVKGYLLNSTGDTLKGEIKMNPKKEFDLYNRVFFKDESGAQKNYKPDKVKGYGFENKHFIASKYEGDILFYKILSKGKIMLYEMMYEVQQMNEISYKSDYFIAAIDATEYEKLKQNKYKKQLSELMKDNLEIIQNADDEKKFEIEKAVELVNQYNDWARTK